MRNIERLALVLSVAGMLSAFGCGESTDDNSPGKAGGAGVGGSSGNTHSGATGGKAGANQAGGSAGANVSGAGGGETAGSGGHDSGGISGEGGAAGADNTAGSAGHSGEGGHAAGSGGANAAGASAQGGSAGTAAGMSGASGSAGAPNCDDGNAATEDIYSAKYGCGHKYDSNPSDVDAWIEYDAGFSVDLDSKLAWASLAGSHNQETVAELCAALVRAGIDNFRIPTINDARTLAAGCKSATVACKMSDPSCLSEACGNDCSSCEGGKGPQNGQYCKIDARVCDVFHTSSLCSDCESTRDWIYSPSNGHFLAYTPGSAISTYCVAEGVIE